MSAVARLIGETQIDQCSVRIIHFDGSILAGTARRHPPIRARMISRPPPRGSSAVAAASEEVRGEGVPHACGVALSGKPSAPRSRAIAS